MKAAELLRDHERRVAEFDPNRELQDALKVGAAAIEERERLREALRLLDPRNANELFERIAADFHKKTGLMAPGKSVPPGLGMTTRQEVLRDSKWRPFVNEWHERFFDSLALAPAEDGGA
jgi:hypothetical protein